MGKTAAKDEQHYWAARATIDKCLRSRGATMTDDGMMEMLDAIQMDLGRVNPPVTTDR
jgi:hypothetical protein